MFTVVIPTFNRALPIKRTIASVLNQTYRDFELIVVDDGSTDATEAVVAQFADRRLRYLYQTNQGRCAARNRGAAAAKGNYLTFLDSDDEVAPSWLECFVDRFQAAAVGVVRCGTKLITNNAQRTVEQTYLPRSEGNRPEQQYGEFLTGTYAVHTAIFHAIGGYAAALSHAENTELSLRLFGYCADHGWQVATVPQPLLLYHRSTTGATNRMAQSQRILQATKYLLEHHANGFFARHPREYANNCSIAGVHALRLGEVAEARAFFARAVYKEPRNWKHYGRLLLAWLPFLSTLFWQRHTSSSLS